MPYFIGLFLLLTLVACESTPSTENINIANTAIISQNNLTLSTDSLPDKELQESQNYAAQGAINYTKNPAFKVKLQPSTKAKALLDAGKENLIVSVVFYGIPNNPDALKRESYYDPEEELIYLLDKEYTISNYQQELLIEEDLPTAALQALKEANYTLVVDAYSSRKSSKNNLFHTKVITGTIEEIKGTTQVLPITLL